MYDNMTADKKYSFDPVTQFFFLLTHCSFVCFITFSYQYLQNLFLYLCVFVSNTSKFYYNFPWKIYHFYDEMNKYKNIFFITAYLLL